MKIIKIHTILHLEMLLEHIRQILLIQMPVESIRLQMWQDMLEKQQNCTITFHSIPL